MLLSRSATSSLMHIIHVFGCRPFDPDFSLSPSRWQCNALNGNRSPSILVTCPNHAVVASLSSEQVILLAATYFVQYHLLSYLFLLHITIYLTKPFQHWGFFVHLLSSNTNIYQHQYYKGFIQSYFNSDTQCQSSSVPCLLGDMHVRHDFEGTSVFTDRSCAPSILYQLFKYFSQPALSYAFTRTDTANSIQHSTYANDRGCDRSVCHSVSRMTHERSAETDVDQTWQAWATGDSIELINWRAILI